jgi:hypothetical protein
MKIRNGESKLFLVLCCLVLSVSACIKGEILCGKCESGGITVVAYDTTFNVIAEKQLSACGPYSLIIPSAYIGQSIHLLAHCDEDDSGALSAGDCFGDYGDDKYVFLNLMTVESMNEEINITIDRDITSTIEGEVSCDMYTSGLVTVGAFEGGLPPTGPPLSIGDYYQLNENKKTSYKIFVYDTPLGGELWVGSLWDVDGSTGPSPCDYGNYYPENPVVLEEEITGIDFPGCEFQIPPCPE